MRFGSPADRRAPQPELAHRPEQLFAGGGRVLHRQGREAAQLVRVGSHKLGHRVVMAPAECQGLPELDVMKIGQRTGRQDLKVDLRLLHRLQAQLRIGEGAAGVLDADQLVVADAVPRLTVLVGAELRAVPAGGAGGRLQPHVGVKVDDRGTVDARRPVRDFGPFLLVSGHCVPA